MGCLINLMRDRTAVHAAGVGPKFTETASRRIGERMDSNDNTRLGGAAPVSLHRVQRPALLLQRPARTALIVHTAISPAEAALDGEISYEATIYKSCLPQG